MKETFKKTEGDEIKSYDNEIKIKIDGVDLDYKKIFDKDIDKNIYQLWAEYEGYRAHIIFNKDRRGEVEFKITAIENMKSRILEPNEKSVELPGEIKRRIIGSVKKFIKFYLNYKPTPENIRKPYRDD